MATIIPVPSSGFQDPEVLAMLQALYSRSHTSITKRVDFSKPDINEEDITKLKKSLAKYYIGYGHGSIGNCGWITLFIEGVSVLAAKAIENHPLFNGQESSTRYLDFSTSQIKGHFLPTHRWGMECFNHLLTTYQFITDYLNTVFKKNFPKPNHISDLQYNNAITSAVFDLARGYLPTGITTQLSWTGHIQSIREHCSELRTHPLIEVRNLAFDIQQVCSEMYPHAFPSTDLNPLDEKSQKYGEFIHHKEQTKNWTIQTLNPNHYMVDYDLFNKEEFEANRKELDLRPKHGKLPRYFEEFGVITAQFSLDYGSFRDLHRHRKACIPLVNLQPDSIIHPYYTDTIKHYLFSDHDLYTQFEQLVAEGERLIYQMSHELDAEDAQYFYPLGWMVPVQCTASLPQWYYMLELRTGKSVHNTLREVMQSIARNIEDELNSEVQYDYSAPVVIWFPRGSQTILRVDENGTTVQID